MSVMFVHGMPSNSRMWREVITELGRHDDEVVAVDLPGFNGPAPSGWVATKENYAAWLIGEIEALNARSGPVHLVGHDWGCILALRAASLRPELLRTVAAGNGPVDPHWPLHALWKIWGRAGEGERFMAESMTPETVERMLVSASFPLEDARATLWSQEEGRALTLSLYRSAMDVGRQWAPDLSRIVIPSLLIWGERDMMVPVETGRRMATRMGAAFETLDAGHFWPYERPEEAAALLRRHFARADAWPQTILTQM